MVPTQKVSRACRYDFGKFDWWIVELVARKPGRAAGSLDICRYRYVDKG